MAMTQDCKQAKRQRKMQPSGSVHQKREVARLTRKSTMLETMLATETTGEELVNVVLSASMPPTRSLWAKYHEPTVMAVMLSLASLSHAVVQKNCAASRAGVR
jgi:hypothetical protein